MPDNIADVGYYVIDEAILKEYVENGRTYNIAQYIAAFTITESINSAVLYATLTIIDSADILNNFPIIGEEIITISYTDSNKNQIRQDFLVYAVTGLGASPQQNSQLYNLELCSPQLIMSRSKLIQKSYTGTTTEIAKKVFEQYLIDESRTLLPNTRQEIQFEDSAGTQTLVIPALSPLNTIDFLKRKSFAPDNLSSHYLFFQTRTAYKMMTYEKLVKDAKTNFPDKNVYNHSIIDSAGAKDKFEAMKNILVFSIPQVQNTLDEINEGSMLSDTIEVDILNKQYIVHPYKYKDNYEDYTHLDRNIRFKHTDGYIDRYFDEKIVSDLIFVDDDRPNQNYIKITPHRRSSSFYLGSIVCKIEIYGRNDLSCGDVLKLNIPEYAVNQNNSEKKENKSFSGFWLINDILHKFEGKEYKCELTLTKDLRKDGVD